MPKLGSEPRELSPFEAALKKKQDDLQRDKELRAQARRDEEERIALEKKEQREAKWLAKRALEEGANTRELPDTGMARHINKPPFHAAYGHSNVTPDPTYNQIMKSYNVSPEVPPNRPLQAQVYDPARELWNARQQARQEERERAKSAEPADPRRLLNQKKQQGFFVPSSLPNSQQPTPRLPKKFDNAAILRDDKHPHHIAKVQNRRQ